ncbi:Gfo/Idh/MocA family protein [Cryptosporangium arvum]|uniref:Putative dehydrogenase n=1 Tax=Cryptosporangium arvum DSM 44712 TaxID=927661 RepID=A0A011ALX5_9ACTN|nr:Gfo/Idh/MocA family oxidoreductase [Cryptosporangium arvum]EXG82956.1 putative dehydrogenase [Cryptosporangium arvum DSM 44712]
MTVRVGLVGAGPWATSFTGPLLAAGPGTSLAAVWARRPEAARTLGVPVAGSFDELLGTCDAVAFAVPPDVQAELAPRAAAAGKHLLLEKPVAFGLEAAERVAAAADEAGVVTQLMLTNRWSAAVPEFVERVRAAGPRVLRAEFVGSGAMPGSFFATPWRQPEAALQDVGPHVFDLLESAAGPARVVHARRAGAVTAVTFEHASGAVSSAVLSIATPGAHGPMKCEAITDAGRVELADPGAEPPATVQQRIAATFAEAVTSGKSPSPDVHRGVELQRLLAAAEAAL